MVVEGEVGVGAVEVAVAPGGSPSAATARALDSPTVLKVRPSLLACKYTFIHFLKKVKVFRYSAESVSFNNNSNGINNNDNDCFNASFFRCFILTNQ